MTFSSYTFLIFFFVFILSFFLLKRNIRVLLFFGISYYCLSNYQYLPLLVISTLFTYFCSREIGKNKKSIYLYFGIVYLILTLAIVKYFPSFLQFLQLHIGPNEGAFPLGISFYTFMLIGFLIQVYENEVTSANSFMKLLSYSSFFITIGSGPLLKYNKFIEGIFATKINVNFIFEGIKRFIIGLFLKVVIVENLYPLYQEVWSITSSKISVWDIWTLAFISGLYIYLDFSAYSHMAIGLGRMIGIEIPENFSYPFNSTNPQEFWKRWHITLSNWLFEYIFTNIQLKIRDINRKLIRIANVMALLFTFFVCGIWHGNSLNFLIWGLYHAMLIILYYANKKFYDRKLNNIFGWIITTGSIMFGWLLFSSRDLSTIYFYFSKVINPLNYLVISLNYRENTYLIVFIIFSFTILSKYIFQNIDLILKKYGKIYFTLETIFYSVLFYFLLIFFSTTEKFIYFQF